MTPKEIGRLVRDKREERRLSQEDLADITGLGQSTIARIEKGEFKRMPSDLPKICAVLGMNLPELGEAPLPGRMAIPAKMLMGMSDFPVYAAAEGGPGEILRSPEPVDFLPRPAPVAHVREAYGMIISGEGSMEPEYRPGDTAIVNPRLPVIAGEVYVFYRELQGEARATIKQLRRASMDTWFVRQHNPPPGGKHDFILSRKEWTICHRVIGKFSRL